VETGKELPAPPGNSLLRISPDGSKVVARGDSSTTTLVLVSDSRTGKQLHQWGLSGPFDDVAFSPEGRHVVTANANGTLYVFRLAPKKD
jgi:WD40 repeat protein